MGGAPDWVLIIWQWDKPRALSSTKVSSGAPVLEISINPTDWMSIVCVGLGVFKNYKFVDGQLKTNQSQMGKKESTISSNYLSHIWISEPNNKEAKLIVGTDSGDLLMLDNQCEYKMCLTCSPFDGWPIECICLWSKGFIVCGDNGIILFFEKSTEDPRLLFGDRPTRTLRIKQASEVKIKTITLSPQPAED